MTSGTNTRSNWVQNALHMSRVRNLDGVAERSVEEIEPDAESDLELVDEDQEEDVDARIEALARGHRGSGNGRMEIGVSASKNGSVSATIRRTKGKCEMPKMATPKRAVASGR